VRYRRDEPLSLTYRSPDDILAALRATDLIAGAPSPAAV
jgi:hypothetical protein